MEAIRGIGAVIYGFQHFIPGHGVVQVAVGAGGAELIVAHRTNPVAESSTESAALEQQLGKANPRFSGPTPFKGLTKEEKSEFRRQHKIVEKGVEAFWQVGQALAVIKKGKLWRVDGHKSWDAYCHSVAGMSRGHAHRLMGAAEFLEILKTSPRGDVLPKMEAQVRPLLRLSDPEQQVSAWGKAVEHAEGGQPSAPKVKEVVFEILHPNGPIEKPTTRVQQRHDLVVELKKVSLQKKSWKQVQELIDKLEKLL